MFAAQSWGRALDDFFITYRYAQNLADGHGPTFNPGETVFGTTAPGFAVLLAAGHWLTGISIPGLGTLSTAVALWLLALLLLDELAHSRRAVEGVLAGSLVVLSPHVWPQHGCEMPVSLVLLLIAARSVERFPKSAGAFAALAAWCRPEAALGAAILGASELWRQRRLPREYAFTVAGAIAAATAFNGWALGSLIPVTLAAKRAQAVWLPGIFMSGCRFWTDAVLKSANGATGALTSIWLGLGIAGAPILLRRGGAATRLFVLYAGGLAVAYPLLGVADAPWYPIPVFLAISAALPIACGELVRAVRSPDASPLARAAGATAATLGLAVPFLLAFPSQVARTYGVLAPNLHYQLYRRTGLWLRDNTPPGSTVAYVEVGTIAYYSERSIQDMLGLVTPRSIPFVPTGDMVGAFLTAPTDYFLYDKYLVGFLDPVRQQPWFEGNYEQVAVIRSRAPRDEEVIIYKRQPGARFPRLDEQPRRHRGNRRPRAPAGPAG